MLKQYIVTKVLLELEAGKAIDISKMTGDNIVKFDSQYADVTTGDVENGLEMYNKYTTVTNEIAESQAHNIPSEIVIKKRLYHEAEANCEVCDKLGAFVSKQGDFGDAICLKCRIDLNEDSTTTYTINT